MQNENGEGPRGGCRQEQQKVPYVCKIKDQEQELTTDVLWGRACPLCPVQP
jgi:hypothetical protein